MLRLSFAVPQFLAVAAPAFAVELVQPADLGRSLFDAKPITTTDSKGRSSQLTFAPGGTLTRDRGGKSSEGKWRLSDDGFCMQLGQAKRESCYIVLKQEDGRFSALKRAGEPFTWTR